MSLKPLDAAAFDEMIYDKGKSCLVVFSRKTCHVCKEVVPLLEELQPKYDSEFDFYYVDIEDNAGLFQRFSLKGVPQILYFKEGEFQGKQAGLVDEEKVEEKIAAVQEA